MGSEMCIRDRIYPLHRAKKLFQNITLANVALGTAGIGLIFSTTIRENRDKETKTPISPTEEITLYEAKANSKPVDEVVDLLSSNQRASKSSSYLFAVERAATSLTNSHVPEKISAVKDIRAGKIGDAAAKLENVLREQIESGAKPEVRLLTLLEIGAVLNNLDTKEALAAYEAAYKISPTDPLILNQLGELYYRQSDPSGARAIFSALQVNAGDSIYWELKAKIGLARFHLWTDESEVATQKFKRALAIAQQYNYLEEEAFCLAYLGTAALQAGNLELARRRTRAALKLEDHLGNAYGRSSIRRTLGIILLQMKEPEKAEALFEEAVKIAIEADDPASIARAKYQLGLLANQQGKLEIAKEYANSARTIASTEGMSNLLAFSNALLAEIAKASGNKISACKNSVEAISAVKAGGGASAKDTDYIKTQEIALNCS